MAIEFQTIKTKLDLPYFDGVSYLIPKQCPHCEVIMIPSIVDAQKLSYDVQYDMDFLSHLCIGCEKNFITTHFRRISNNSISFVSIYPELSNSIVPTIVSDFSPQFANIYKQATIAENLNHIELATTGYRMALEILVKDFLIAEYPNQEEQIKHASLDNCLLEYFQDVSSSVSIHAIKSLGNDYVHYVKKHTNAGFDELKFYFDIFVHSIETRLKLKHPVANAAKKVKKLYYL